MLPVFLVLVVWYVYHYFVYSINGGQVGRHSILFPFQCFFEDVKLFMPFSKKAKLKWMKDSYKFGTLLTTCGRWETSWRLEDLISEIYNNQKHIIPDGYYDVEREEYFPRTGNTYDSNPRYKPYRYDEGKLLLGFNTIYGYVSPYFWAKNILFLMLIIYFIFNR